jgi:transcriptional regulator with XRE-family HTH domain
MWAKRVKLYRQKSGMPQEQLAEMFGVDVRSVRRWEAGTAMPSLAVRKKLLSAPVPAMASASVAGFAEIIRSSPKFTALLSDRHEIIAASASYEARMLRVHGPDWRDVPHLDRIKSPVQEIITATCDAHGGLDKMMRNGLSSLTHDFTFERDGRMVSMRFTSARLFVNHTDSVLIHASFGTDINDVRPDEPQITYLDEIMSSS